MLVKFISNYVKILYKFSGYVPLPVTKIDFSSDLERPDPNQKKKKRVIIDSMYSMHTLPCKQMTDICMLVSTAHFSGHY